MSIIATSARAATAVGRRVLSSAKARKALASLGATALAAGASLVSVSFTGSENEEQKLAKVLAAAGNPQTMAAVITKMLGAVGPDQGHATLRELEDVAAASENPEIMLAIVEQIRSGYGRALNTGDGVPGSVSGAHLSTYLKGHAYIQQNVLRVRRAASALGMTPRGLRDLRAAILMDEDLFEAIVKEM